MFFNVHYVLIYQTVTSQAYVFVRLDFRPHKQTTEHQILGVTDISAFPAWNP
ncbi:hypothetical protein NJ45_004677 [Salmonella enterica subsp. enterica]|nr:hypothetical protein [Salmonella enterica subsp. enterica]